MINTTTLFHIRRLGTLINSSLVMSDYWEDLGDLKKAERYTKAACEADEEIEELLATLSPKELTIALQEEERQRIRYRQYVTNIMTEPLANTTTENPSC